MAYRIKMSVPDAPMFDTEEARRVFMRNLAAAVEGVLQVTTGEIQKAAPAVTGRLSDSFLPDLTITADKVQGTVGTHVEYFLPVELGQKAHFVPFKPVDPLALWAKRKFGVSDDEAVRTGWAVRMTIKKRGAKGRFFVKQALENVLPRVKRIMARVGVEVAEELVTEK